MKILNPSKIKYTPAEKMLKGIEDSLSTLDLYSKTNQDLSDFKDPLLEGIDINQFSNPQEILMFKARRENELIKEELKRINHKINY